ALEFVQQSVHRGTADLLLARRQYQQDRPLADPPREQREGLDRGAVRPMQILQGQQQRLRRRDLGDQPSQRLEQPPGVLQLAAPRHAARDSPTPPRGAAPPGPETAPAAPPRQTGASALRASSCSTTRPARSASSHGPNGSACMLSRAWPTSTVPPLFHATCA